MKDYAPLIESKRQHGPSGLTSRACKPVLAIALIVIVLSLLKIWPPSPRLPADAPVAVRVSSPVSDADTKGYAFYEMLKKPIQLARQQELDAPLPSAEGPNLASPDLSATSKAPAPEGRFFVQLGAFRQREQAEAALAQGALEGLRARIEIGDVQGMPIYRVRVDAGEASEAAIVLDRLRARGWSVIVGQRN